MKLYNPTNNEVRIVRFGVEYSIPAKGYSDDMPDSVAEYWMKEIHAFLEEAKPEPVKAEKAAKVEIPVEEAVKEAAPKAKK